MSLPSDRSSETPSTKFGFLDDRPALIPLSLVALVALVGVADHPYTYYLFLRGVVTGAAALVVFYAFYSRQPLWLILAAFMATIWAPAGWFQFEQSTWRVFDLLLAASLAVAAWVMRYAPGPWFNQTSWWKIALVGLIPVFFMVSGAFAPAGYEGVTCDDAPYGC